MKIFSIDIETTGLDPATCQMIEFGCAYVDTKANVYKKNNWVIEHDLYHGEPYALAMNQRIFTLISDVRNMRKHKEHLYQKYITSASAVNRFFTELSSIKDTQENFEKCKQEYYDFKKKVESYNVVQRNQLVYSFMDWLMVECGVESNEDGVYHLDNVAGKNFAMFDLRFLTDIPIWKEKISFGRRILDPAILYVDLETDEQLPNLSECKKRAKFTNSSVSHKAVDDAEDVLLVLLNRLSMTSESLNLIRNGNY